MSDYYNILGVDKSASQDDIKKAYRKLASQHHPDRGGDTKKFQEIQAAYDTLGDPEKKAQYDNPPQQQFNFNGGVPPGFDDIINQMFGNNMNGFFRPRRAPDRNKTLNLQTSITLEEAYFGKDLIANITLPSGRDQMVEVKIPPGIQNGNVLRLTNMGDDSFPNLPRGDIHLTVIVNPHNKFERVNDDLQMILDVDCLKAIIGTSIQIETLDKKTLELNIPAGIQHGQVLSAQGYGMPNINDGRFKGRLLIKINIVIPTNLSTQQKDIIKQLIS